MGWIAALLIFAGLSLVVGFWPVALVFAGLAIFAAISSK